MKTDDKIKGNKTTCYSIYVLCIKEHTYSWPVIHRTSCMEQSSSWEADSSSDTQGIPRIS